MSSRLIIALVSGKGGVGKTMLSVAAAKELSLANRTLIVDLDFFNRGLTGLMRKGPTKCDIDKPTFLLADQVAAGSKWRIVEVAKNLFHIEYPDLLPEEMQKFETLDVEVLRDSLRSFIYDACEKCECESVVLDCHGGPDNSSFAACLFADYSLLISEPDRITFYGTLNFIRQLKRVRGDKEVNLYLVFNKVVPAFSGLFLRSVYNKLIREQFSGRPLLGIFPLEVYLTKEFEKTPFLTGVYPYSWLARKTRTLLSDLLSKDHRDKLPQSVRSVPKWMRAYTRLSLGRQLPPLNVNVVMLAIVTVVFFLALSALTLSQFFPGRRQTFQREAARINILQCLDKSETVRSDPGAIDEIMKTPNQYSPLLSRLYINRLYIMQEDRLRFFREELLGSKDSKDAFKRQRELLEKSVIEQHQISSFRKCAYPNFDFSDLEEFEDRILSQTEEERYYPYPYRRFPDYNSPSPKILSDSSPFVIYLKRREVLNNLKPKSVPESYLQDYHAHVQNISNVGRFYLTLQALTEIAFSPSGSKGIAIAAAGWLSLVLLLTWSTQLDRRFTYYSRLGRFGSLLGPYLGAFVLWFFPVYGAALVVKIVAANIHAPLLFVIPLIIGSGQTIRAHDNLRYERNYLEGILRMIFVTYLILGPITLYSLFMR